MRDEKQHGHHAGPKAGWDAVLADRGERSAVEVDADHGDEERGDEHGYGTQGHGGGEGDGDEDRADQVAGDADLEVALL